MKHFLPRFFLILGIAWISMGSIRKTEDPVAATAQTGPISLQQKLEEEKDGKKGAPSPSMTFYGHRKFMTTPSVNDKKPEEVQEDIQKKGENGEDAEFETGQETPEKAVEDDENWWSEGDEESFPQGPSKPES